MKTIRLISSQWNNIMAVTLLLFILMVACNQPPATPEEDNAGYLERRQWLLEQFRGQPIRESPKAGMIDALGRLYLANGQDEEALEYISQAIHERSGGEFKYPYLVRALYMFGDHFNDIQIQRILEAMTKKWAGDLRNHGTENHAAMRVTSQYLLAQYFPKATWEIGSGQVYTSEQMMEEAKERILKRGWNFFKYGNNEMLSSTYFSNNTYPFLNLMEYAEDPDLRAAAEALVLYHTSMIALNDFDGHVMPPFNRRNGLQQRFGPAERIKHRYMPNFHRFAWLFWGQNEVIPEDFTAAAEPAYPLMYALSDWKMPPVLNRLATGEGTPYEIRGILGPFGRWDGDNWIKNPDKMLRYVWRDKDYAVGGPVAHYFGPSAFTLDYHVFGISWKSSHRFRSLEAMHPYWRSNMGEDYWKGTHSPFQQFGIHQNTAIVLFNIPEKDPWPDRADQKHWLELRDEHSDRLIQLGQVRFPVTVDELEQNGDFYFFREGGVYVAVRVLKPGHTIQQLADSMLVEQDGYSDLFHVIKSREAQTGFVIEVGTEEQFGSFGTFKDKVTANPLTVDWDKLEVSYTNCDGDKLKFAYDKNYDEDKDGFITIKPALWINGMLRDADFNNCPIAESPVVKMDNGILDINDGKERIVVDWQGDLPEIIIN